MTEKRLFNKVLIANRGEIALRILRALRLLGIGSVAVYHAADRKSPLVRLADEAVEITGINPSAAHLDIPQLVAICRRCGVNAVHPGYGFLSENAAFARALAEAGIQFIGPDPDTLELMGDKITSREFVAGLGFPVPPSVSLAIGEPGFAEAVAAMQLPLVVKASAGGGGKGMSIVRDRDQLAAALRVAASEAEKYFGDGRVYIERYFDSARHIEVQVLGDGERAVHLGERECSLQRRFQKIVEESPSPALSAEARAAICETAVGIAAAAKYRSAGTGEFLYTPEGEFFFLEMNTRIQVEHPVTEMVYGVDLVAEQIRIAAGQPLALRQSELQPRGHAIECRICAEDPANQFMPETGRVLLLEEPRGEGVRVDSGLYEGQEVSTAFDPMLAKLVVHAPDRQQASARMIEALQQLVLLGVTTNIDFLVALLRHPDFASGDFDTGFVQQRAGELFDAPADDALRAVLIAGYLADRATRLAQEATPALHAAIGHWRN
jgi:propionyl-CoA carboxylase alpha chain/3-methylcrotonyl-CoA carboxylase alpha subunit/acetyl-CoA/propionyl-CoA carboxylase biotin carboxyl carrier protein